MVGAGEDVSDPDGDEPAVGESLVERVGREMAVEDLGELELDEESQEQGHVIDAFVGQFEGGVHGGSPTRDLGKPSLYRGGQAGGKIQAKKREHGNYREVRLRRNCSFTVRLIREIGRLEAGILPDRGPEFLGPVREPGLGAAGVNALVVTQAL